MAFKSKEDRTLATDMLEKGHKAAEVVDALAGRAVVSDIYLLKSSLKKSGELSTAAGGGKRDKDRKPRAGKATPKDGFEKEARAELKRLKEDIEKKTELSSLYEKKNTAFSCYLEDQIEANQKKVDLIEKMLGQ